MRVTKCDFSQKKSDKMRTNLRNLLRFQQHLCGPAHPQTATQESSTLPKKKKREEEKNRKAGVDQQWNKKWVVYIHNMERNSCITRTCYIRNNNSDIIKFSTIIAKSSILGSSGKRRLSVSVLRPLACQCCYLLSCYLGS